jgi:endoglucanase
VKSNIVDPSGRVVYLTGVSWFGMESQTFCPHGLWARNWQQMLDQIVLCGFNSIRLPYSNQIFDAASTPNGIDFNKNPDLKGLTGIEIMDRVVHGAGQRGLRVILDRHRPDASGQSPLWYTDHVSEERWIADWVMLAKRYRTEPGVIGVDLHNEPHSPATWGDGNVKTDWRLAAERAGNAILEVNPDWLIIVEGIDQYDGIAYWWGGNLMGAGKFPIRLTHPDKLVYSAHDYGPGVWGQSWFGAPNFPQNLPALWHQQWAYLVQEGIAPVWIGEFGGRSMGTDPEGVWQRSLVTYLKQNHVSYAYWAWNPNSGDTGGILEDDWQTINRAKIDVLSAYQWPLLAKPSTSVAPAVATPGLLPTVTPTR